MEKCMAPKVMALEVGLEFCKTLSNKRGNYDKYVSTDSSIPSKIPNYDYIFQLCANPWTPFLSSLSKTIGLRILVLL